MLQLNHHHPLKLFFLSTAVLPLKLKLVHTTWQFDPEDILLDTQWSLISEASIKGATSRLKDPQ